ncbi:hypothetical protein niasHT_023372 [Heterodera trifolii]|uniref:Transmembrane protein n=1 Tax=Heterodera trifolii TaxID=157864 RepID=A0ABD2K3Z3_9BILA
MISALLVPSALSRRLSALYPLPTVSRPISARLVVPTIFILCSMLFVPPPAFVQCFVSVSSEQFGNFYRTVCAFPSLADANGCQRGGLGRGNADGADLEDGQLLNGWFCDPGSTMSMSEVFAIDETLRRIYEQNRHNCICRNEENVQRLEIDASAPQNQLLSPSICWFRFGFAFVPELSPGPDSASAEHCANNNFEIGTTNSSLEAEDESNEQLPFNRLFLPPEKGNLFDSFTAFADNYAQVLRERWHLGECGEDILILIVQTPPQMQSTDGPQSSAHSRPNGPFPMLFLSLGPLVTSRLHPDFAGHALRHILFDANAQLQHDARPLFKVLNEMLLRMDAEVFGALAPAEFPAGVGTAPSSFVSTPHARHRHSYAADGPPMPSRSHIPPWAWAVFGACGVACALMALGLFLIRSRTRRSGAGLVGTGFKKQQHHQAIPSSSMMSNSRRHWKESSQFGKDDQPPSTTYVNLVQLLMPHPKPPPVSMPQQV